MADDVPTSVTTGPLDGDGLIPAWEFEPWRIDEITTPAQRAELAARVAALRAAGHAIGDGATVSRLAVVDGARLRLGDRSYVAAFAHVTGDVEVGDDCSVNVGVVLRGPVRLGRAVRIGTHAALVGFDHGFADPGTEIFRQPLTSRGIEVGDDVWIGAHALVRDGVRIGAHSVVGAGAVVTRDVPEGSVVVGNPARIVRSRLGASSAGLGPRLRELGERARADVATILDDAYVDGAYRDRKGATPTVRAHSDAIELAELWAGTVPAAMSRDEHIAALRGLQDSTDGLVPELGKAHHPAPARALPDGDHAYHVLCVGYALELLGSEFAHPVHAVLDLPADRLVRLLDALDWRGGAWGAGATLDAVGTALTWARLADPGAGTGLFEAVTGWVLSRRDAGTGLWGSTAGGLREPVNGTYRLLRGTLAQWDVPGGSPRALVDTLLRRAAELPHDAGACDLLDVAQPLWWAARTEPGYRRDGVVAAATAVLERSLVGWRTGEGWAFAPSEPPSLMGTELWAATTWFAADLLGLADELGYRPRGVHRPEPRLHLGAPPAPAANPTTGRSPARLTTSEDR